MLPQLRPGWPLRPPTWRWQRVQRVVDNEDRMPPQNAENALIVRGVRFLRGLNSDSPGRFARLMRLYPTLFDAYQLYSEPECELTRFEIDARILAGQSTSEIATSTRIRRDALLDYEAYFFDVRDRLDNRPFIINHVLGPSFHRGQSATDMRLSWATAAYFHGSHMLKYMIEQTYGAARPQSGVEVRETVREERTRHLERKSLIAAKTLAVNGFTQLDILELVRKYEQEGTGGGAGGGGGNQKQPLEEAMAAMLELIPIDIGRYVRPRIDSAQIRDYDDGAVQLNTRELLAGATTDRVDESPSVDWPAVLPYPEPTGHVHQDPPPQ